MNKKLKLSKYFLVLISLILPSFALEFELYNIDSNNNAISASGYIENNDTENLKKYLSEHSLKKPTYIVLNILGGKVAEGITLGNYFRENKIQTVILQSQGCISACVFAFWGGTDLSGKQSMRMNTNSILGVHALSNKTDYKPEFTINYMLRIMGLHTTEELEEVTQNIQKAVVAILEYSQTVNIPSEILIQTFSTPSDKLYCITSKEAQAYGIKIDDYKKRNTTNRFWDKEISKKCINK